MQTRNAGIPHGCMQHVCPAPLSRHREARDPPLRAWRAGSSRRGALPSADALSPARPVRATPLERTYAAPACTAVRPPCAQRVCCIRTALQYEQAASHRLLIASRRRGGSPPEPLGQTRRASSRPRGSQKRGSLRLGALRKQHHAQHTSILSQALSLRLPAGHPCGARVAPGSLSAVAGGHAANGCSFSGKRPDRPSPRRVNPSAIPRDPRLAKERACPLREDDVALCLEEPKRIVRRPHKRGRVAG